VTGHATAVRKKIRRKSLQDKMPQSIRKIWETNSEKKRLLRKFFTNRRKSHYNSRSHEGAKTPHYRHRDSVAKNLTRTEEGGYVRGTESEVQKSQSEKTGAAGSEKRRWRKSSSTGRQSRGKKSPNQLAQVVGAKTRSYVSQ